LAAAKTSEAAVAAMAESVGSRLVGKYVTYFTILTSDWKISRNAQRFIGGAAAAAGRKITRFEVK
jgi:hypothetical protein